MNPGGPLERLVKVMEDTFDTDGLTWDEVCDRAEISRNTFQRLKKRMRAELRTLGYATPEPKWSPDGFRYAVTKSWEDPYAPSDAADGTRTALKDINPRLVRLSEEVDLTIKSIDVRTAKGREVKNVLGALKVAAPAIQHALDILQDWEVA